MVLNAKKVITYTKRYLVRLVVNSSTKTYEHPIFAGVFLFFLLLYKYLPYLFSFLVFLSPIVICTGLLLGVLLCYGQPTIRGIDNDHDTAAADELLSLHDVCHDPNEEEDEIPDPITVNARKEENSMEAQGSYGIIVDQDASESDSDHSESSSPDASMTDIIPMLDELHPLLDSEEPEPLIASTNDTHSPSGSSMEETESEEEAENTEEGIDEESEDKNADSAELAVKWTEDDEKNVIVLGTSDLERNQRLENLIAKRRARKSMFEERNLIDLDGGETVASSSGFPNFQAHIHPISVVRHNPFDLPYDNEEASGFHQIPGSAPSVLLPRQNPFDSPPGSVVEGSNFSGFSGNNQGFAGFHQRDIFFRRHESFAHVAPFASDIRVRPYFVNKRANVEETSYAHLQRQLSDKSESKDSSSHDSESGSSENDQAEENLNLEESEFGVVLDSKTSEVEKSSSNEAGSVDSETLKLSANETIDEEAQHDIDASSSSHVAKSSDHTLDKGEDSLMSVSTEAVIENDAEPVYDLSPSAVGKYRVHIASFEKEFLHADNETTSNLSSAERDKIELKSTDAGDIKDHRAIHVEHTKDKDEHGYVGETKACSSSAPLDSDSAKSIEPEQFSVEGKAAANDELPLFGGKDVSSSGGKGKKSESEKEEIPAATYENSGKGGDHHDDDERQQDEKKSEIFRRVRSRRYYTSSSSSSSSSSSESD